MNDVIIIGAGPAGLSAAIYTARAGLKTVIIGIPEKTNIYRAHILENYLGFDEQITGRFLLEKGFKQAEKFGAKLVRREVVNINNNEDGTFSVTDSGLHEHITKTIIICCGIGLKPSGIKNEAEFMGKGVSCCVTCDGPLHQNKNVAVIGNGDFAADQAIQLLAYTKDVTILSHGNDFIFNASMKESLKENNIILNKSPRVTEFVGDAKLEKIKFADNSEMVFDAVFLALGVATAADFAKELGLMSKEPGNAYLAIDPDTGKTNVSGVFAAGDCTGGYAQAIKSAGEGCVAAISVVKFLKGTKVYVDYC